MIRSQGNFWGDGSLKDQLVLRPRVWKATKWQARACTSLFWKAKSSGGTALSSTLFLGILPLFIISSTHQTLSPGNWVSSPSLSDGQHKNKQTHRKTQQPLFRLFESHKKWIQYNIEVKTVVQVWGCSSVEEHLPSTTGAQVPFSSLPNTW